MASKLIEKIKREFHNNGAFWIILFYAFSMLGICYLAIK